MLIFGDSRLVVDIFPTGIVLQLLGKLLLCLQELPHHLSLGDHIALEWSCWEEGEERHSHLHQSHWEKHEFVPPSEIHEVFIVTYSQACLQHPQEEYAKRKLIASIW
jgi:hypothetical protein